MIILCIRIYIHTHARMHARTHARMHARMHCRDNTGRLQNGKIVGQELLPNFPTINRLRFKLMLFSLMTCVSTSRSFLYLPYLKKICKFRHMYDAFPFSLQASCRINPDVRRSGPVQKSHNHSHVYFIIIINCHHHHTQSSYQSSTELVLQRPEDAENLPLVWLRQGFP